MIPFNKPSLSYFDLKEEIDEEISKVLTGGEYILGESVEKFETEWANYCQAKYAIGVGNGLDALILALRALKINEDDEVIVPGNTFIATWLSVSSVGAKIVPIDPNPNTYNIEVEEIERAITNKTKAVIVVHLYGQPVDLDPIMSLLSSKDIFLIEDAAQAHGALYKGKKIGSHGQLVCWSFYPGKNLGAFGDAGGITTDNEDLYKAILKLRNYGSQEKYKNEIIGCNSRLDPIQAAVLSVKLKALDQWTNRRNDIAQSYLSELSFLKSNHNLDLHLPCTISETNPVWHLFVIRTGFRDELQAFLRLNGVDTLVHYPIPPHQQFCYKNYNYSLTPNLPITETLSKTVLSLPVWPQMKRDQVDLVIEGINSFYEK